MATYLNRERFQSLPKPKTEDVYIEEWDLTARVRAMSAGIAMDIISCISIGDEDAMVQDIFKVPGLIPRVVIDTVVDDDGRRVFTQGDFEELDGKPAQELMPIVMAAVGLTNFGEKPEKNSGTGLSAGSSSD